MSNSAWMGANSTGLFNNNDLLSGSPMDLQPADIATLLGNYGKMICKIRPETGTIVHVKSLHENVAKATFSICGDTAHIQAPETMIDRER